MADFTYSDHYIADLAGRTPMPVGSRFFVMMRYLEKVAPEGRLPGRRHIDPLDLRSVMGLINLVDVERTDGDLEFRYRLVGEEQTQKAGCEFTGKLVSEALAPELVPRVEANMRKVLATGTPVFDCFPVPHPNRDFIASQRMYYSLAEDGETVDMILALHSYDPDPALEQALV